MLKKYTYQGNAWEDFIESVAGVGKGDMNVQLSLDHVEGTTFTNLDFIKGRVILTLLSQAPISSIDVKLEGEARTQVEYYQQYSRASTAERPRSVSELHKILYISQTVFPPPKTAAPYLVLAAGRSEYPFSFKVPFNTQCHLPDSKAPSFSEFIGNSSTFGTNHIKANLPPTLYGLPGQAQIKYYLKVTVRRKEFYKENPRHTQLLNFLPIEPPRPPLSKQENYGRRMMFPDLVSNPSTSTAGNMAKMKRALSGFSRKDSASSTLDISGIPQIQIDLRLPEPAVLTCIGIIPMRLLLRRLDNSESPVYLETLQISVTAHTRIRAQGLSHDIQQPFVVTTRANMAQELDFPKTSDQEDEKGEPPSDAKTNEPREIALDPLLWATPLPNTIPPSFETCNMKRTYTLDVKVGIGYGPNARKNQDLQALSLKCQIYSGIKPPQALLDAVAKRAATSLPHKPVNRRPLTTQQQANVAAAQAEQSYNDPPPPLLPTKPQAQDGNHAEDFEEPPPSYEDAIAMEIAPIDGPRNYQPPPAPTEGREGFAREKGRRDS